VNDNWQHNKLKATWICEILCSSLLWNWCYLPFNVWFNWDRKPFRHSLSLSGIIKYSQFPLKTYCITRFWLTSHNSCFINSSNERFITDTFGGHVFKVVSTVALRNMIHFAHFIHFSLNEWNSADERMCNIFNKLSETLAYVIQLHICSTVKILDAYLWRHVEIDFKVGLYHSTLNVRNLHQSFSYETHNFRWIFKTEQMFNLQTEKVFFLIGLRLLQ
jgi:hypothetical protein